MRDSLTKNGVAPVPLGEFGTMYPTTADQPWLQTLARSEARPRNRWADAIRSEYDTLSAGRAMTTEQSAASLSPLAISEAPATGSSELRRVQEAAARAELDALMDRYSAGDEAAFPELYRRLAPRLRMFLLRLSGTRRLADDLLQDTFLRIHRARGTFTSGAQALPWSYAIARNSFVDHFRKTHLSRATSLEELPEGQPTAPSGTSPEAEFVGRETLAVVRATLAKLPVAHRDAFILLRFEGLSVAEAALVLGASEANVKVRAFRAYEAFRLALRAGDDT